MRATKESARTAIIRGLPSGSWRRSIVLVAGFCLVAGVARAGPCIKTSQAARAACVHGAQNEYRIQLGICYNVTDDALLRECRGQARTGLKDSLEECGEQLDARNEVCDLLGDEEYDPLINPTNFVDKSGIIANPNRYFPLIPGTVYTYEGPGERVIVTVTDETKQILGVQTIVVNDVAIVDGQIVENTDDWFAQDILGNVWYFGEISQQLEDNELVSVEGSWKAGVAGAKAGILMLANPTVDDVYRQEWAFGEAEDLSQVVSITASETVPQAVCNGDCVKTNDFTPLEPGVVESKFYAPNVGLILEVGADGGRLQLTDVSFRPGAATSREGGFSRARIHPSPDR